MMSLASVNVSATELHKVFVYGSLLADDVVRVILNRVPQSSTATLNGYHRFSVKGRVYPAILPVQNKKVTGKVFFGITDPELHILDMFEDDEYQRTKVEASLMENAEQLQVQAYVWANKNDPDLFGEWDFEEWKRAHMNDFVKMTSGFMEEIEQTESKTRVATYESFFEPDGNPSSKP